LTLALLLAIARTARPAGEQARDVVENLLLPGINLVRMHPVPLRQFRNRRILAQRLKRNLRLERCIKLLACLRHSLLHRLRQSRTFHTLANGPKSGVQLTRLCSQTSTCTMCWMNGSSGTCACASKGTASSCGTPMTA